MSGWFFSPWWTSHLSSCALGWSGHCGGSGGGILDILVVYFIAGMSGMLFLVFVRSLFRFGAGVGGGAVAGRGIILTCPLCILIVVINNFVYSI